MFKRFLKIFLIAIIPFFFVNCFDGIGGCAPDYEESQSRLYTIDLDGQIIPIEKNWVEYGHGSLVFYGLDESKSYLYYTDNSILSPEEIIRLNYQNGAKNTFILDKDGEQFSLSPNGSLFVFENNPSPRTSDISIVSLSDSVTILAPRDSLVKSNRLPKWISQNVITYNAYDQDGIPIGIFKANIADSTFEQLTEMNGKWGYDISENAELVVFSSETKGSDGLSKSSIFIKKKDVEVPFYVGSGTYPQLIPSKNKFIYSGGSGIMISDFNGNKEILYTGNISYRNLSISPDGKNVVLSNTEGIFLIDTDTKEITQLTEKSDYITVNGQWESINSSFNFPIFSAEGTRIFFVLSLNYFDDGC